MSKYRKSSLSPCWSALTANKENLNQQNVVSFKSMAANKKSQSKRHDLSPHHVDGFASIYTNAYRQLNFDDSGLLVPGKQSRRAAEGPDVHNSRDKGLDEEWSISLKAAKNDQEYKDIIKSKDKQISSLHSQVKVLENTIDLLKSQVDALAKENRSLAQSSRGEARGDPDKLARQNTALRNELKEYEQIVPKLNELQIIQNALIGQNREMKAREQRVKGTLREIRTLLGSVAPCEAINKMYQLMGSLLN